MLVSVPCPGQFMLGTGVPIAILTEALRPIVEAGGFGVIDQCQESWSRRRLQGPLCRG